MTFILTKKKWIYFKKILNQIAEIDKFAKNETRFNKL